MLDLTSATVSKVSTLADKSIKIELHTREMSPEDMTALMTAYIKGDEGVLIKEPTPDELETKSPQQRLRNVLYVLWDTNMNKTKYPVFDTYYKGYMEQLITTIKERLPDKHTY